MGEFETDNLSGVYIRLCKYRKKVRVIALITKEKFLPSLVHENVFKFVLARKQNMLMSQPCLHTLMQTRLSANQTAGIVLVILLISRLSDPFGVKGTVIGLV